MKYDKLLNLAETKYGLTVKEKPLRYYDGLISGQKVAIRQSLRSRKSKSEVLAEEIGHAATSAGDITNYDDPNNWKQEVCARTIGYQLMISDEDIVNAYKAGCQNYYELAEYLDVDEGYLRDAIECYRGKYGRYKKCGDYIIVFEPNLAVIDLFSKER